MRPRTSTQNRSGVPTSSRIALASRRKNPAHSTRMAPRGRPRSANCFRIKTGDFKEPHPKAVCDDNVPVKAFAALPYPQPEGLWSEFGGFNTGVYSSLLLRSWDSVSPFSQFVVKHQGKHGGEVVAPDAEDWKEVVKM